MFIDDQFKKNKKLEGEGFAQDDFNSKIKHQTRNIIIFIVFCLVLVFIILGIFFAGKIISKYKNRGAVDQGNDNNISTSSPFGGLPEGGEKGSEGNIMATTSVQAENLFFGDFYKEPREDFRITFNSYELPMNVKTDVSNYYELNRKIDLESKLDSLNNNGFTILENKFREGNDFFSSYRTLESEGIPTVLTKDFLVYYYHNILESNYKEIERVIFFENLWDINKHLYGLAKDRYENLLSLKGLTNDPILEASRREAAYFAVALKLLEPNQDQIKEQDLVDQTKFSIKESYDFYMEIPAYLKVDVLPEVAFIESEQKEYTKSPVLLYMRDYNYFNVPEEYIKDARLRNYYLASRWLNSNLPLFYKEDSCPDCYADKADWRINMLTAFLVSEDFYKEQVLKNKWAQVYKVLSFFKGLGGGSTYLEYQSALRDVLGDEYDLKEEFWGKDLEEIDISLNNIQKEIINDLKKVEISGNYINTTTTRPQIGMRILSEPYVPCDYIYKSFTYPKVGLYEGQERLLDTICKKRDIGGLRCKAFNYDIVNLFTSLKYKKNIFDINSEYNGYYEQVELVKRQLDGFTMDSWHNSNYWSTWYMIEKSIKSDWDSNSIYTQQEDWLDRNVALVSGALANLQLSADKLQIYEKKNEEVGFGDFGSNSNIMESRNFNYIEPGLVFVQEMKANTQMLQGLLDSLEITKELHSVDSSFNDFIEQLERVEGIVKKELSEESLTEDDHSFISNFTQHYEVGKKMNKVLTHENAIGENIDGVKLLIFAYEREDGQKMFVVGPIFNYGVYNK
ncbi:DUF3160 domain-containing protein [bacterium]|nr:DUF3160 domain-containing protein [bacterium]